MERIDFYEKKKALHLEMMKEIANLFEAAGVDEMIFYNEDEYLHEAYLLYCPDGAESIQEQRVKRVRCNEGLIEVVLEEEREDKWISCQHGGDIMTDSLDSLYDAVFDAVYELFSKQVRW